MIEVSQRAIKQTTRDQGQAAPDIHLRAARFISAHARVLTVGRLDSPSGVGLAIDELQVARALRIAVAGTILGTGLVARVFRNAALFVHRHKVQGSVETASRDPFQSDMQSDRGCDNLP